MGDFYGYRSIEYISDTCQYEKLHTHRRAAFCRPVYRDKPHSRIGKELNIALFTRNNRSVELTAEGEQFKDYAEKVITLTNASLSEISSLHKYANHLRIGCSDSIYEGHLAPIILEHQRQFPNDALKITIGLSNLLMEQLQNDIFDVIFTYLPMKNHPITARFTSRIR